MIHHGLVQVLVDCLVTDSSNQLFDVTGNVQPVEYKIDCNATSQTRSQDNSSAVFGFHLTDVILAHPKFETCFTILVAVTMIVADLMSILRSTVKLPLRTTVLVPSSSSQYLVLGYGFFSIATAFPPTLTNTSLRKKTATLLRLQNELWTTMRQHPLAQFPLVDVHESIRSCLCGNGRVQDCGTLAKYVRLLLLLPLTC